MTSGIYPSYLCPQFDDSLSPIRYPYHDSACKRSRSGELLRAEELAERNAGPASYAGNVFGGDIPPAGLHLDEVETGRDIENRILLPQQCDGSKIEAPIPRQLVAPVEMGGAWKLAVREKVAPRSMQLSPCRLANEQMVSDTFWPE